MPQTKTKIVKSQVKSHPDLPTTMEMSTPNQPAFLTNAEIKEKVTIICKAQEAESHPTTKGGHSLCQEGDQTTPGAQHCNQGIKPMAGKKDP